MKLTRNQEFLKLLTEINFTSLFGLGYTLGANMDFLKEEDIESPCFFRFIEELYQAFLAKGRKEQRTILSFLRSAPKRKSPQPK